MTKAFLSQPLISSSKSTTHDSQPLKEAQPGERWVDAGEYRIIYSVAGDWIDVLVIGKRVDDEVYKTWER